MRRAQLALLGLIASTLMFVSAAYAGPPWTEQEFFQKVEVRRQVIGEGGIEVWWAKQPQYLKSRVLNAKEEMWWPTILCNYLGYKPEAKGTASAEHCETRLREDTKRGEGQWTANGQFNGAPADCKAANKRDQYGRLVCN